MIAISGLCKAFGARDIFVDTELQVTARDRVAVVGPNGAGKTTLFDMIAGRQQPDSGTISLPTGMSLGYLQQETDSLRGRSLLEEVLTAGEAATAAATRLEHLHERMTKAATEAERDEVIAEFSHVHERFESLGGYELEHQAKKILGGLGFATAELDKRTESFSGGELMRIALAKLLLARPELLLLDEPTNHLDVDSVEWLERFLRSYQGAILLISHDRVFINAIATKVTEVEAAKLVTYHGNFESFVEQRAQAEAQREAAAKNQAKRVAQVEQFIERFRYKASKARQVQSRIKMLEKMERVEAPSKRGRAMKLGFPQPPRSPRVMLELEDVTFGYSDTPVYERLNFSIERGQKIALVGPNGAGKTTLLKLAAGVLDPSAGTRRVSDGTFLGYFAQHQIEALDPSKRVIEELQSVLPSGSTARPRDLLGRFLFSGDDVDKPVRVLSGGERTRLAMCKMLASPVNLLCLDEPTNHLDMQSRDALEDALEDYQGSILLITHDRHLISSIAGRIVEVVDGKISDFAGDYDYYLTKREERSLPQEAPTKQPSAAAPARPAASRNRDRDQRREGRSQRARLRNRVERIERDLEAATSRRDEIAALLSDPDFYRRDEGVASLVREFEQVEERVEDLEKAWEEAALALDEVQEVASG